MPKSDLPISGDYAPVADRIQLFYERYPQGQILSRLVARSEHEITFVARVYREPADTRPSATGWASERIGDGDVNSVACLENTETSAIGRALANLGFTASKNRPSAEEMAKVARERTRLVGTVRHAPVPLRVAEGAPVAFGDDLQRRANALADTLALLDEAEREGLHERRIRALRHRLMRENLPAAVVDRTALRLRTWIDATRHKRLSADQAPAQSTVAEALRPPEVKS
jgi:hypothetical protein